MTAAAASPQTNPFPGLRPFREDEEHLFFGRENQVDTMVNKLAETHFLAIVGTSGSGKSSLVNCGLRPALRQGLMARAGTSWRMAQFRPGNNPIGAIARALAQDGVLFHEQAAAGLTLGEIIETTLRISKLGLIDICEQAALGEGVNLLVVVDQFEELFRYRQLGAAGREGAEHIGEEATAFVNLLLEVKERQIGQIFIVLTMRSDFLGDCTQFRGLAEAINAGQYLVPRMTRDERRAAIAGPVGVGGAEIAPVLLTRLVNDVGDNPDQLSILQHALNRTWACRQGEDGGKGPLNLAHYEAIGTMAYALDQHAEQGYAELSTARQQQICEKVFTALTDKATDPRGVRRPSTLAELCSLTNATAAEVTDVIAVFRDPSRSFLMPPAGEALEMETVIDISHESLMRVWQRLTKWADEEARSARIYRRLADTADLHAAGNADLLRDPELQLALDWHEKNQPNEAWASRYHPGFAAAMRFLTESSEARDAERAERQRQRAEAERQRTDQARAEAKAASANRVRNLGLAVAGMGLLAIFLLFLLVHQLQLRQAEFAREAEARDIAGKAEEAFKSDRELASRLAIEAAQVPASADGSVTGIVGKWVFDRIGLAEHKAPGNDAVANLLQRVVTVWNARRAHAGRVLRIVFSAYGRQLATSGEDGTVKIWNADDRRLLGTLGTGLGDIYGLAFKPDGTELITANMEGKKTLWNVGAPKKIQPRIDLDKTGLQGIIDIAWLDGKDGSRLIVAAETGVAEVWDPINRKLLQPFGGPKTAAAFALSADGSRLATVNTERNRLDIWNKEITKNPLWSVNSNKDEVIQDVVLSPDGRYVASVSKSGLVQVWEIDSKSDKEPFLSLPPNYLTKKVSEWSNAMAFSSDRLAIAYADTVAVWDIAEKRILTFVRLENVTTLALSLDGKRLAAASRDGTFWVLPLDAKDLLAQAEAEVRPRSLSLEECEIYQVRRCMKSK